MRRTTLLFSLAAASLVLAAPLHAAKEKSDLYVKTDPSFWDRKIKKIALLGMTYPDNNDAKMEEIVPDLVNEALQSQGDFTLLFPADVKMGAEAGGAKDAYEQLIRVWRTRGELDPPALEKVIAAIGADAIAGGELTHWEQHKLEFTEEGNSTTTVGVRARLWDAHDRTLLWEASRVKISKSPPYDPSGSVASDAGGTSRQITKSVPEPPKYEKVAKEVIDEVIGSFPKASDKEKGKKGDKGKDDKEKDKDKDKDKKKSDEKNGR